MLSFLKHIRRQLHKNSYRLAMLSAGVNPSTYIHFSELVGVTLGSLGIAISYSGFSRVKEALQCVFGSKRYSGSTITVLNRWINATYASGGLVVIMSLAHSFNYLNDSTIFGAKVSASFSALIYAVAISELFLRPTLSKLVEHFETA
ncbi:hypothetical protein MLD52_21460 [Puniceicoccaceae bacterium K14]|nr:hypothetical protein [Puniceicoccaceae bacterium K14]